MYPEEYIEFLIHFHGDRDYFECHEILEEYWKSTEKNNKNSKWVGLILLAVSSYHHRRGNLNGAERTLNKAITILQSNLEQLIELGLDSEKLLKDLTSKSAEISAGHKYSSYNLPIKDPALKNASIKSCLEKGLSWCSESDLNNEELIHRHSRRDRSMVISERLAALHRSKR